MRHSVAIFLVVVVTVFAAIQPVRAIEVQRVVSPGGIEAWLVEDHTNPIIAVNFAFRGGGALDPKGREGLANMVSGLIDEGAGDLDSQTFQGRLEDLAASLSFDAGRDTFTGQLRTLTENRDAAFDLLRLAVTKARFDDEPVSRIRQQILAGLRADSEDPDFIAGRTLSRTLFPDHPYGRPTRGTKASVGAVTAEDLRQFVVRRLARDNLIVGVVGDIDAAGLARVLDSTFDALPANATPWRVADTVPQANGRTIVVRKPVPQSAILFAQAGLKRDDPDFYAAFVVNQVLGGSGFTSRLYDEVREKRGLAYSVGSRLYPFNHTALVIGSAGTANPRAGETVDLVRQQWRAMAETGPTAAELTDVKTYLTGSFPLRFSSSGRIARMLVGMQLNDLGIDYLERRNDLIDVVTLDDVRRVARRLFDADSLVVIVVGEPEGIE
jgi:zinc protease